MGWIAEVKPAIGMVHLPALPGSPSCVETLAQSITRALRDAEALIDGGMDGLMIENFGDTPFFPSQVPPVTIAAMTATAAEIRRRFSVPLGINVLRNDAHAALAVALASGANFIRVNVLCGARVTDQGIVQGPAHTLLRERRALAADDVQIWADVQVKHSSPISPRPLAEEVVDTIERGQADAVIVSGSATGRAVDPEHLSAVKQSAGDTPVVVGSGISVESLPRCVSLADGFIVGTSLKHGGQANAPVDVQRVKDFVNALRN
ncbi:MAG: BtpA/SgcQ family protein [Planctomycetales bacterium]|nr:BtpA/SgcQ family protein [Planctomycetales bacterium]